MRSYVINLIHRDLTVGVVMENIKNNLRHCMRQRWKVNGTKDGEIGLRSDIHIDYRTFNTLTEQY